MGLSLANMAANTAFVTITIGEAELHVEYYPANVTEEALSAVAVFEQQTQASTAEILDGFAIFNQTLASLIKDWDFYEDAAMTRKVEISASRLRTLPLALRAAILSGIIGDLRPEAFTGQVQAATPKAKNGHLTRNSRH